MSEPIRSISEGTFVIGDTNGLTFEAGPGISVSQPSEGTVRIANDETVLWSGTIISDGGDGGTYPRSAALSESIENFNYVRVEGYCHNGTEFPWTTTLYTNGAAIYGIGLGQWKDVTKELDMSRFKLDGSTVSAMEGTWIIPSQNWGNTRSFVTKVVGINRISGGNNE